MPRALDHNTTDKPFTVFILVVSVQLQYLSYESFSKYRIEQGEDI